jgi:hypothetical protein
MPLLTPCMIQPISISKLFTKLIHSALMNFVFSDTCEDDHFGNRHRECALLTITHIIFFVFVKCVKIFRKKIIDLNRPVFHDVPVRLFLYICCLTFEK